MLLIQHFLDIQCVVKILMIKNDGDCDDRYNYENNDCDKLKIYCGYNDYANNEEGDDKDPDKPIVFDSIKIKMTMMMMMILKLMVVITMNLQFSSGY